jgi:hypothetical protein
MAVPKRNRADSSTVEESSTKRAISGTSSFASIAATPPPPLHIPRPQSFTSFTPATAQQQPALRKPTNPHATQGPVDDPTRGQLKLGDIITATASRVLNKNYYPLEQQVITGTTRLFVIPNSELFIQLKERYMIVVTKHAYHANCVPITTHGGHGITTGIGFRTEWEHWPIEPNNRKNKYDDYPILEVDPQQGSNELKPGAYVWWTLTEQIPYHAILRKVTALEIPSYHKLMKRRDLERETFVPTSHRTPKSGTPGIPAPSAQNQLIQPPEVNLLASGTPGLSQSNLHTPFLRPQSASLRPPLGSSGYPEASVIDVRGTAKASLLATSTGPIPDWRRNAVPLGANSIRQPPTYQPAPILQQTWHAHGRNNSAVRPTSFPGGQTTSSQGIDTILRPAGIHRPVSTSIQAFAGPMTRAKSKGIFEGPNLYGVFAGDEAEGESDPAH